jgi:hypothetical protein
VSQIRDESHVRFYRAQAQPGEPLMVFSREVPLFQSVLQVILRFLKGAGGDPEESRELLRVVATEAFRGVPFRGSDRIADLIAVLEIS